MRRLLVLASAGLLTAYMTATPPSQVTRFHRLDAATPRLPFYIAAPDGAADGGGSGPEWSAHASAVASALERHGYRCALRSGTGCMLPADSALAPAPAHRVMVRLERMAMGRAGSGPSVNVGVGGSTGSYGSGVGVGVGVDITRLLGGGSPDMLLRLSVRIDGPDRQSVWEGRAEMAVRSGTPAAQPGMAAARLTDALFTGFPGRSGETITVP